MNLRRTVFLGFFAALTGVAHAQSDEERFERQLQQIRQDTLIQPDKNIPIDQRATFDYGGYVSFGYLSLQDNNNQTHGLRQSEVVGYARANFDGAHEFFVRYRTGYRDFNTGDSFSDRGSEPIDGDLDAVYYQFDLARYDAAYHGRSRTNNLIVKAGRDLVYWGNGLTLSQTIDGIMIDATTGALTGSIIAGVTPTRTVDFDSSRPDFDFNTHRGFYGGMLSAQVARHRPFAYGLIQRDYNKDETSNEGGVPTKFDYNSYYIGVGSSGALTDRLLYGLEGVYEGGRSLSNSFTVGGAPFLIPVTQEHDDIQAWAADARLDYLLNDSRHTRLSAEGIIASGDSDRMNSSTTFQGNKPGTKDHGFNGFGLLNTGLAFAPTTSNLLALRLGGSTFPFSFNESARRVQFGSDLFLFGKLDENAPIDEPTADQRFLGWEPDFYLNWQITSDVTFAARYGIFFPDSGAIPIDSARQFLFLSMTYAF